MRLDVVRRTGHHFRQQVVPNDPGYALRLMQFLPEETFLWTHQEKMKRHNGDYNERDPEGDSKGD